MFSGITGWLLLSHTTWSELLLTSQTVIVIDNHRSGLHLLQHSWMLLLLINLRSSFWSLSFCWKFSCRPRCIALRAMLVVRQQLFSLHRFLMLPSTEAGQTLPLVYIHSWSTFIVLLYGHLRTTLCSDCVFVRIAPLQCSQICNNFETHFDFCSTA